MTKISIKLKCRFSATDSHTGTLRYQLIKDRKAYFVATNYRLELGEWCHEGDIIVVPALTSCRYAIVSRIKASVEWEIKRLKAIVLKANDHSPIDEIVAEFRRQISNELSVFEFIRRRVNTLHQLGRLRSSQACQQALSRFMRFRNNDDLPFTQVSSGMMQLFEAHLKNDGLAKNSTSFYMRQLRVCYNLAVEEGLTDDNKPFKRVFTSVEKTLKRAIPLNEIKKIANIDLLCYPSLDFARDIFMFSFLTRGMSFIDIAHLTETDIQNDLLVYRRRKTGQRLEIGWEKSMQRIVSKYSNVSIRPYLLPIIVCRDEPEEIQCKNMLQSINRNLAKIGRMLKLNVKLTTYVARHSWASAARDLNIPIPLISEGLGHDNIKTTQIYLSEIKSSVIDRANHLIISDLWD